MVGVTFNDLSHDVREELEVVAKVGSLLECADPSPTRYNDHALKH